MNTELEKIMIRSFGEVLQKSEEHRVPLRIGAYILAVDRVARATRLRGHY